MHVLVMGDEIFAARERALIRRLEIGLADEGVRVTHAYPDSEEIREKDQAHAVTVACPPAAPLLTRGARAERLVRAVNASSPHGAFGVVHVFGGSAWDLGIEVGRLAGAPVILEVWRAGLTDRTRNFRGLSAQDRAPMLMAPDPAIERALMAVAPGCPVRLAPWGVYCGSGQREILKDGRTPSVMIAGPARSPELYRSVFEGVVSAASNAVIFVDADAGRRAGVWAIARQLDALDRVSLIHGMEGHRELVLEGDILIHPEGNGEQRSLVLDAMGAGMAVIAAQDPDVSWLEPERTAHVVADHKVSSWKSATRRLLETPTLARDLGSAARSYVREHHRVSAHVARVMEAYEWLRSPETIPFSGEPTR